MEAGSKIEKLVIGARDLKDHLGRYLVQGLVVSVFLHSAIVTLVGMWPKEDISPPQIASSDTIAIYLSPKIPRSPRPESPKPKPIVKLANKVFVPVENEPQLIDTLSKPVEDHPDLNGTISPSNSDGDSIASGGLSGMDTEQKAGIEDPWIYIRREIEPVALDINPQPDYPKFARISGVEGKVTLWVHVSEKGDVLGWHVIDVKPAGLGFEDEVARVIPKWKFTPAIQQNTPVAVWVAIPFKFRVSE